MSETVFRDYDQAALDAQYNLRAAFPDFQDHFDAWDRDSARVRDELECRLDVPYDPASGETLDIFPAPGTGNPVHVFIHGGYWRALDKKDHSMVAPPLVNAGCAVVVPNYTLAPAVTVDEIVRQVRAAVAWSCRNAADFGGDPERITVSGHSAGGHLTAMVTLHDWAGEEGLPAQPVKGACAISGLFDLEPIRLCYLNEDVRLDEAGARRNSPLLMERGSGVPLVVAVGGAETDEFRRQSAEFAAARQAAGQPTEHLVLDGHTHFTILQELTDPAASLTQTVVKLAV